MLRVVLARAARSARLTTHFDLESPRAPQRGPYWCHKHKRECRPVEQAKPFLRRYTLDTLTRIKAFAKVRAKQRDAHVVHGDAREVDLGRAFDGVVTSPPYPGLIDYHEQHRAAYELLGLDDLRDARARRGRRRDEPRRSRRLPRRHRGRACARPRVAAAGRRCRDRRQRPPQPLPGDPRPAGLRLEERLRRHVNRRTGRRAGEFFEDVLVAR